MGDFPLSKEIMQSDDGESFESTETLLYQDRHKRFPVGVSRRVWMFTLLNAIIFAISSILFIYSVVEFHSRNSAEKRTSWYSPVLDSIDIERLNIRFNGTIWPGDNPSWSRIEPGPEADVFWDEFDPIFAIPITREEIVGLGKDPDYVARLEDDFWGLGDNAYIGALDVFHQLHCLNALRKTAFADYVGETFRHDELNWIHLRHCVDMIAQNIVCHADADIHTYNWMDTQTQPFPDFSINRQCRSLEQLKEWRDERVIDMEKYKLMKKPKGVKQVPAEPDYYAMFGYAGSDLYPDKAALSEAEER